MLFAGFVLLPHVTSFVLLSLRRPRIIAAGAGIACGLFSAILLASPGLLIMMFLFIGLSAGSMGPRADPGLVKAGACLLAYLAIAIWIGVSALRIGKIRWSAFIMAICATWVYLFIGFPRMRLAEFRAQQHAEQQKEQADMKLYTPQMLARQRIVSLSACFLQDHMVHPNSEFPASLEQLPADSGCERAPTADTIPEYTFTYTPQTDAATGHVNDFQLIAIPKAKGVLNRNPMLIDGRGIVFVDYPWEMENVTPRIMVLPSDRQYSQIDALKGNIESYIRNKGNGIAPATLNAEIMGALGHEMPTIAEGGKRLETRDFVARYFGPKSGDAKSFAISVQCQSYAQNCVRSFFSDYDGTIHATGEPRQASADDPIPPQCENGFSECMDVAWTVP